MNKQAQEDVLPPLDMETSGGWEDKAFAYIRVYQKDHPAMNSLEAACVLLDINALQQREDQLREALTRARKAEEERDIAIAAHGKTLLLLNKAAFETIPTLEARVAELEADDASDLEIMARVIEALDGTPFSEPIPGERHSKFLSTPARVKKLRERAKAAEARVSALEKLLQEAALPSAPQSKEGE